MSSVEVNASVVVDEPKNVDDGEAKAKGKGKAKAKTKGKSKRYSKGMNREIPCDPYDGATIDESECDKKGMRVKKVAIYIDYHIIDEEDYMDEEDADPVKDILAWGRRALPFEVEFFGGLPKTFKMEYIEEEDLFCVSYDRNPKCAYEDASVAISDPDEDGNFPIIKGEPIEVEEDDEYQYEDDGYYLVSGAGGIRRIVLTY